MNEKISVTRDDLMCMLSALAGVADYAHEHCQSYDPNEAVVFLRYMPFISDTEWEASPYLKPEFPFELKDPKL